MVEFRSADWERLGVAGDDDLGYGSVGERGGNGSRDERSGG